MPWKKFCLLKRKKRQRKFYGSEPIEGEATALEVSDTEGNLNDSVSSMMDSNKSLEKQQ